MTTCKERKCVLVGLFIFLFCKHKFAFGLKKGWTASSSAGTRNSGRQQDRLHPISFKACHQLTTRGGSFSEGNLEPATEVVGRSKNGIEVDEVPPDESLESMRQDQTFRPGNSSRAMELRFAGMEAHDKGDFKLAAVMFQQAADELEGGDDDSSETDEEYATYRLHEALCHLKSEDFSKCVAACSDVLEDSRSHMSAVRARAYHRRAKAKLALNDQIGALEDARSGAFLGDRKAVALYGRLMRQSSPSSFAASESGPASASESSFVGGFPSQDIPSAALFESLLSKSTSNSFFADKGLVNQGHGLSGLFGGGEGGLAQSVLSSLGKRLDDDRTQSTISAFLQSTDKIQMQQYASMAGLTIPEQYLDIAESAFRGVTPKKIKIMVFATKSMIYTTKLLRRVYRLIQKYKSFFVVIALFQWTKSAILRPIPIDPAVKRAAKGELKKAMKANRTTK